MGNNVIYQGLFVEPESKGRLIESQGEGALENVVSNMHCTFRFRPSLTEIRNFSQLLGREFELKVVGYYSDGKNSGFEVELPQELESVYTNVHNVENGAVVPSVEKTTPHITISMSEGAKASDTGMLPFEKIEEPFFIRCKPGFWVKTPNRDSMVTFDHVLSENVQGDGMKGKFSEDPNI